MRKLFTLVLLMLASLTIRAEELQSPALLYISADHCGACMKFEREVGSMYLKTQEQKQLPMIKIDFEDWKAGKSDYAQCEVGDVFATPTFIHIQDCKEMDRITGYSNDELFWFAIHRMLNTL